MKQYVGGESMVSGARDIDSMEAKKHAALMYESIRRRKTDVEKIVSNLRRRGNIYTFEQVNMVKNYLFVERHYTGDTIELFDPDYIVCQSWERLTNGHGEHIKDLDLLLLDHELYEMQLLLQGVVTQREAHIMASMKYDFQIASNIYYGIGGN